MTRRLHVVTVQPGIVELPEREAHHARDVLRMNVGETVELFDDVGNVANARIVRLDARGVSTSVGEVRHIPLTGQPIVVASAVPKADRADWMIEKLSELGTSSFVPLASGRSIVLPDGKAKRERWVRIATESAKQSRRNGVMQIELLTPLDRYVPLLMHNRVTSHSLVLSTQPTSKPIVEALQPMLADHRSTITLLIGPEGGWTDEELLLFTQAGLTSAKLTTTILRVETAAVAAAAVTLALTG